MKRQFLLFIFITCAVVTNVQSANQSINGTYNILNYGADTLNVCTQAINNAIESAYRNGGGKVIIPAGRFRSGTIFLKDNIELHLSGGAILEASDDYSDFPLIPSTTYRSLKDAGGWSALIYAEKANHISITGKGTIDGKGKGRKGRVQGVAGDCNGRPRNILLDIVIACDK